ncbi:hypothetical protein ACFQPA_05400 [Halomarina halobia]|uniref:DUF8048 domain-containing protein n=1 Tax=Halomarina halobia TaxID=3033386 RepID=A0ABD6A662_9EURY|nr:hypothetical protein [Halomarina sp. PSR21]
MPDALDGAFDAAVVARIADAEDLSVDALWDGLRAVQDAAARHVGIDGLVYEWRTAFREDPLVARTPEAYALLVEPRVWDDFADRCGFDDRIRGAVMAVHDAQVRRDVAARDDELLGGEPLLLARA